MQDTIFALSSGGLPSGVAVIRISGPLTRFVCETICETVPAPRELALRSLRGSDDDILDRGLVAWFPAPHSFTGEDCAEFQVHGGKAVVSAILRTLGGFDKVRQAEAGEFTRRAFLNGKLDLVQAEALSDLIAAETEVQRRFARQNAEGRQSALYAQWRQRLLNARAMVEAELDFADEGDVPSSPASAIWEDMERLTDEISRHLAGFHMAEVIRDGFDVVILGRPNAGKSSLLNALAQRDVAIVSSEAGTTRDLIEVTLDLNGYKVRLTDTAGLRQTENAIEREGVSRALARAENADLVLHLVDGQDDEYLPEISGQVLRIGSKSDLEEVASGVRLAVSSVTGRGIDELLAMLTTAAEAVAPAGNLAPTRIRQVKLLETTALHIAGALSGEALELRAEELRLASAALGRITGAIDVEDLLGAIFSTFCIGK